MIQDCCIRFHSQGESVCPVCFAQSDESRKELNQARAFRAEALLAPATELIARGAIPRAESGLTYTVSARTLQRNPARRELFRLTGVYLPEREARAALARIHEYKWLESERVGFDTWVVTQPDNPLRAAALDWSRKYLQQFIEGVKGISPGKEAACPG